MKKLIIAIAIIMLLTGCAKEPDFEASKSAIEDNTIESVEPDSRLSDHITFNYGEWNMGYYDYDHDVYDGWSDENIIDDLNDNCEYHPAMVTAFMTMNDSRDPESVITYITAFTVMDTNGNIIDTHFTDIDVPADVMRDYEKVIIPAVVYVKDDVCVAYVISPNDAVNMD